MEKRTKRATTGRFRPAVDIDRIAGMDLAELRKLHRKMFGCDTAISNAEHLRRKIAWQVQAEVEGGLPESALQRALAIAATSELRVRVSRNVDRRRRGLPLDRTVTTSLTPARDSRIPMAGSILVKTFKDRSIVVKVLETGFDFEGRRFPSLSAVANHITGSKWNGYVFFGLRKAGSGGR